MCAWVTRPVAGESGRWHAALSMPLRARCRDMAGRIHVHGATKSVAGESGRWHAALRDAADGMHLHVTAACERNDGQPHNPRSTRGVGAGLALQPPCVIGGRDGAGGRGQPTGGLTRVPYHRVEGRDGGAGVVVRFRRGGVSPMAGLNPAVVAVFARALTTFSHIQGSLQWRLSHRDPRW